MSGIAAFMPNQEMYDQMKEILKTGEYHVKLLKLIDTDEAVYEARSAITEEGIHIVIARGKQAEDIRKYTNVAVSEIRVTAQELGVMVCQAKEVIKKKKLRIAVFYWGNMLCDTSYFETLYGVQMLKYRFEQDDDWRGIFAKACLEKPDVIIAGEGIRDAARQEGIPVMQFISTEESLRAALDQAEALYHMAEVEQRNYAQFSTILDSSFNGIMKITNDGKITVVNRAMEQIAGISAKDAFGKPVDAVFQELDMEALRKVLNGEMENYTTLINRGSYTMVFMAEPILVEGKPVGAILSCNRLKRLELDDKNRPDDQYLRGYVAHETFDSLEKTMPGLKEIINKAKLYAQSSNPILIEGYPGPEQDAVCQGIHNYSPRKSGPYIVINLAGMSEEKQMRTLFGQEYRWGEWAEGDLFPQTAGGRRQKEYVPAKGAIEQADKGTLVIQSIDKMTLPVQYHLSKMLRSKLILHNSTEKVKIVDIRIVACTSKDINLCRKMNRMRGDLYYSLKALVIRISPLRERPGDMEILLDACMRQYLEQYHRYHTLTAGARKALLEYHWPGNAIQMRAFCERMILTAERRTITEEYVRSLLEELYLHTEEPDYYVQHDLKPLEISEKAEILSGGSREDEMREEILRELKTYHGNRTLAARALGISTTTLWRRMKSLEIRE